MRHSQRSFGLLKVLVVVGMSQVSGCMAMDYFLTSF